MNNKLDDFIKEPKNLKGLSLNLILNMCGGDGKLLDGKPNSSKFRNILSVLDWGDLEVLIKECEDEKNRKSIPTFGFALQDIVNELGRRLEFNVVNGFYRGSSNPDKIGVDGLWKLANGKTLLIEVKTSENHNIDLKQAPNYRDQLHERGELSLKDSSILYVFVNEKTESTEEQIRGSKWAWDIRIITLGALAKLVNVKTEVEDQEVVSKIHEALFPRQFTKLDSLFELLFDVVNDKEQAQLSSDYKTKGEKVILVNKGESEWQSKCLKKIEKRLSVRLIKRSRSKYQTPQSDVSVLWLASKWYQRDNRYWYSITTSQLEILRSTHQTYLALGCNDHTDVFLFPAQTVLDFLDKLSTTPPKSKGIEFEKWHIKIQPNSHKNNSKVDKTCKLISVPEIKLSEFKV